MCSCPPQYSLVQQRPGEQADADRGGSGPDHRGGFGRGGRNPTGRGQRRGGSHLQLLLLPRQPPSGLPLHHDDPHQLVQVSKRFCRCSWRRDRRDSLTTLTLSVVLLGSSGPTQTTRPCRAPCRPCGWRSAPAGSDWPSMSGPWWPRLCSLTETSAKKRWNLIISSQRASRFLYLFLRAIALASNQSAWFFSIAEGNEISNAL